MDIRLSVLPHEAQYCLDGASEYGEITAGAYTALMLYGDPKRVDEILEYSIAPLRSRNWMNTRARMLLMERYAAEICHQLPHPRRVSLALMSAHSFLRQTDETAQYMADCFYEDATVGGYLENFRKIPNLTTDYQPTPRVRRYLYSPTAIRRYVKYGENIEMHRNLWSVFISIVDDGLFEGKWDDLYQEEYAKIEADFKHQQEVCYRRVRAAAETLGSDDEYTRRVSIDPNLPGPPIKKIVRARRRVVKRAITTVTALLGASAVSAFAKGLPVVIHGQQISFVIERNAPVISSGGHGALKVHVHELRGNRLGSLCIYQEKTPPLDQLASLALHVMSGDEAAVLDAGNLYSVKPHAYEHPALKDRLTRKSQQELADRIVMGAPRHWRGSCINQELQQARRRMYVTQMKPVFLEAVRIYACGASCIKFFAKIG